MERREGRFSQGSLCFGLRILVLLKDLKTKVTSDWEEALASWKVNTHISVRVCIPIYMGPQNNVQWIHRITFQNEAVHDITCIGILLC